MLRRFHRIDVRIASRPAHPARGVPALGRARLLAARRSPNEIVSPGTKHSRSSGKLRLFLPAAPPGRLTRRGQSRGADARWPACPEEVTVDGVGYAFEAEDSDPGLLRVDDPVFQDAGPRVLGRLVSRSRRRSSSLTTSITRSAPSQNGSPIREACSADRKTRSGSRNLPGQRRTRKGANNTVPAALAVMNSSARYEERDDQLVRGRGNGEHLDMAIRKLHQSVGPSARYSSSLQEPCSGKSRARPTPARPRRLPGPACAMMRSPWGPLPGNLALTEEKLPIPHSLAPRPSRARPKLSSLQITRFSEQERAYSSCARHPAHPEYSPKSSGPAPVFQISS